MGQCIWSTPPNLHLKPLEGGCNVSELEQSKTSFHTKSRLDPLCCVELQETSILK